MSLWFGGWPFKCQIRTWWMALGPHCCGLWVSSLCSRSLLSWPHPGLCMPPVTMHPCVENAASLFFLGSLPSFFLTPQSPVLNLLCCLVVFPVRVYMEILGSAFVSRYSVLKRWLGCVQDRPCCSTAVRGLPFLWGMVPVWLLTDLFSCCISPEGNPAVSSNLDV